MVVSVCVDITVTLPYPSYESVLRLAQDCQAKVKDTQFTDVVTLYLRMISGTEAGFLSQLTELLRGQEQVTVSDPYMAPF